MKHLVSFLTFLAALLMAEVAVAEVRYVAADALNCREEPVTSARVVTQLRRGNMVITEEVRDDWVLITSPRTCWVSLQYLTSNYVAPLRAQSDRGSSVHNGTRQGGNSRPRSTPRQSSRYAVGECPCSGRNVCIGPRGGRYCITSGGNKRYGV